MTKVTWRPFIMFSATALVTNLALGVGCKPESLELLTEIAPPPSPSPTAVSSINLNVNYCTKPTEKVSFKTKFVVVFDRSGSNQVLFDTAGNSSTGTDPGNDKRFGGMLNFVNTLTTEQQQLYSFALISFSAAPTTYDFQGSGPYTYAGIAQTDMDRGAAVYGSSFMSSSQFAAMMLDPNGTAIPPSPTPNPPPSPVPVNANGQRNPYNEFSTVPEDAGWTDYILALRTVYNILASDLGPGPGASPSPSPSASPAPSNDPADQVAYVIIWVSDGAPRVFFTNPTNPYYTGQTPTTSAGYEYREPWADPNAPAADNIKYWVDQLTSFENYPNVLAVSFNTVFYSAAHAAGTCPDAVDIGCGVTAAQSGCGTAAGPNCVPCVGGDPSCTPWDLLNAMKTEGGGQYLDYSTGQPIDFTRITLPSMNESFNLIQYYANNRNTTWYKGALSRDTDGDGLSDEEEKTLGYDPALYSTLGNGVSDWVTEHVCPGTGLTRDPTCINNLMSFAGCAAVAHNPDGSFVDTDNDDLNDCEELLLGSNPKNFDSNGDFLPDALAAIKGIYFKPNDPPCTSEDELFDGINDCQKAAEDLPINTPASQIPGFKPYQYTITGASSVAGGQCYSVQVSNVSVLSAQDQIEFMAIEQPDLFQSNFIMRKAVKTYTGGTSLTFDSGDFP